MEIRHTTKFYFLFLLVFLTLFFKANAQDTLYKINGDIEITKILEVNTQNVTYKKFANLEGPDYLLDKTQLFMIRYQNGTKDVFLKEPEKKLDDYATSEDKKTARNRITLNEAIDNPIMIEGYRYAIGFFALNNQKVEQLLLAKNDKRISLMIKTAQSNKKTSKLLAFAPIPCGVVAYFSLLVGSSSANAQSTYTIPSNILAISGIMLVAGIGTAITSIVLNSKSKKLRKQAVQVYNLKYYGEK